MVADATAHGERTVGSERLTPELPLNRRPRAVLAERADWDTWVRYFLNGVARQCEDALSRSERINRLLETWRSALVGKSGTRAALQLLDLLGSNPFITPRGAQEKLDLAYNTVMRAIGLLQEQGIVAPVTAARRHRVFCAKPLLDILEEPARISAGFKL